MFILGIVIGLLLGFFTGSLYYAFILDEVIEAYNEVKEYENRKSKE